MLLSKRRYIMLGGSVPLLIAVALAASTTLNRTESRDGARRNSHPRNTRSCSGERRK